jgi:hypothetical protein
VDHWDSGAQPVLRGKGVKGSYVWPCLDADLWAGVLVALAASMTGSDCQRAMAMMPLEREWLRAIPKEVLNRRKGREARRSRASWDGEQSVDWRRTRAGRVPAYGLMTRCVERIAYCVLQYFLALGSHLS